ncbi:methyl-accepting chemotaxis protein [Solidesulfovibrio sp.]|jgi:methyl-accepting chemotaxis protein|uniref:methyl-accepting chemotaxis protein n=1 Tax=Solidesulfovibrio sp. TaxID=2910990 RepID=UPI002B203BAF|nr:methyl-accepting chemotaxis protein [Solidesulfovibrio sp.]MEA5087918.1 methyl-accepting chemotaxis protein [Solidesulfovibrio sp.]
MRLSLRTKFFTPILALVVIGMALLVILNDRATKSALEQVESQSMTLLCQSMANDVTGTVKANLRVLASFAKYDAAVATAKGDAPAAGNALLATLAAGLTGADYANIFDLQGVSRASSNVASVGKIKVADRDYFALVTKDGKTNVVSKAIVSRTTGKSAVVLAQPIRDASGQLVGVLNTGMDLESLTNDLSRTKIGQTGYAFILDAQGMVLAHPDKSLLMKTDLAGTALGRRILAVTGSGAIAYADATGNHLAAVSRDPMTGWFFVVEAPLAEFQAFANAAAWRGVWIAGIVTAALVAAIIVLLRVFVLNGLRRCVAFSAAVAEGDFAHTLDIRSGDELQVLGDALTAMRESITRNLAEAKAKGEEAAAQAALAHEALAEAKRAQQQAEEAKTQGLLLAADKLQGVMQALAEGSSQLGNEVASVVASVGEQERRTAETATAMEEMNATVLEVARNASEAAGKAAAARDQANEGREVVEKSLAAISQVDAVSREVKAGMDALGEKAQSIGAIMNVISDIADQTNLLALNAAIEAARAGDAGRGFAVVADEVRKLAEKTMTATKEVGDSIGAIQKGAKDSIAKVGEAAEAVARATELAGASEQALRAIVALVDETSSQVQGIAAAAEEQSAASEEINRAEEAVSRLSSDIAQGMRESSGVVSNMTRQVDALEEMVAAFRDNCVGENG